MGCGAGASLATPLPQWVPRMRRPAGVPPSSSTCVPQTRRRTESRRPLRHAFLRCGSRREFRRRRGNSWSTAAPAAVPRRSRACGAHFYRGCAASEVREGSSRHATAKPRNQATLQTSRPLTANLPPRQTFTQWQEWHAVRRAARLETFEFFTTVQPRAPHAKRVHRETSDRAGDERRFVEKAAGAHLGPIAPSQSNAAP